MKEKRPVRTRWLTIRLDADEEEKVQQLYHRSTCRSLSEYARAVLLKAPVTIRYRNASADDFLEEMIALKKELDTISNNFSQSVRRLEALDTSGALKLWLLVSESQRTALLQKTGEILQKADQIYLLWSQK